MADINVSTPTDPTLGPTANARPDGAAAPDATDADMFDLIELLFFAYRDFVSDPDEILERYGFGRAHHRVVHFVARNPGMPVAELLDILRITKQSLARVLRELIDDGFIEQRPGDIDRRQRLLHATEKGRDLARDLAEPQSRRIARALNGLTAGSRAEARDSLVRLIDDENRASALKYVDKAK
jgi:DNA-binding MarR family transcriptional regulator